MKKCCICGKKFDGWGNNPAPAKEKGRCCDECNTGVVLPLRIAALFKRKATEAISNGGGGND